MVCFQVRDSWPDSAHTPILVRPRSQDSAPGGSTSSHWAEECQSVADPSWAQLNPGLSPALTGLDTETVRSHLEGKGRACPPQRRALCEHGHPKPGQWESTLGLDFGLGSNPCSPAASLGDLDQAV